MTVVGIAMYHLCPSCMFPRISMKWQNSGDWIINWKGLPLKRTSYPDGFDWFNCNGKCFRPEKELYLHFGQPQGRNVAKHLFGHSQPQHGLHMPKCKYLRGPHNRQRVHWAKKIPNWIKFIFIGTGMWKILQFEGEPSCL